MVLRVEADDADSRPNNEIFYKFKEGEDGDGYFDIDINSGSIYAVKS